MKTRPKSSPKHGASGVSAAGSALPLRGRPRERLLLEGAGTLGEIDLLALVLGTGVRGESAARLAARVLHGCGGLPGLRQLAARELAAERGIGAAKAARVLAALELGLRASSLAQAEVAEIITSASDVQRWAQPALAHLSHEEVWLVCLDAKNRILTRRRIGQGGLHGCALTAKDVLRPAIRDAASALVLVHNHPSGDATPSRSDVEMTQVLASAAQLVGLQLLDHVVVSRNGCASLFDLGLYEPGRVEGSTVAKASGF